MRCKIVTRGLTLEPSAERHAHCIGPWLLYAACGLTLWLCHVDATDVAAADELELLVSCNNMWKASNPCACIEEVPQQASCRYL